MMPPVGKSGPVTMRTSSSGVVSGFSMMVMMASHTSRRLCGGTSVAIPTAMPEQTFTSRFGTSPGSTTGSSRVSS